MSIVVLQQAGGGPLTDVDWVPIMLWTIVGEHRRRDRAQHRVGDPRRACATPTASASPTSAIATSHAWAAASGQAFMVIAGLGVIVLCAFEADWFWIANTMFFGFALSTFVGGIASVIAYRRGLV